MKKSFSIFLVVLMFCVIAENKLSAAEDVIQLTAAEILSKHREHYSGQGNSVDFVKRIIRERVRVSGTVIKTFNFMFKDVKMVCLGDKQIEGEVLFQMNPSELNKVEKLKQGQNVVIEGVLTNFDPMIIGFTKCRLVSTAGQKQPTRKQQPARKQQRKKRR